MKEETRSLRVTIHCGSNYYDSTFGLCMDRVTRLGPFLHWMNVEVKPLSNVADAEKIELIWGDSNKRGRSNVLSFLPRPNWWAVQFCWLEWFSGCRWLVRKVDSAVASKRHCLSDALCRIRKLAK